MPIAPEIHDQPLPYVEQLDERRCQDIDLVVIHCTELPDLATAREYGERVQDTERGTGFSGHFYVDRDGGVYRYVPALRVAHHTRGYNPRSIGIELVNTGRFPDWLDSRRQIMSEPYPSAQINALLCLLALLKSELPELDSIAGHEDLDRGRVASSDAPGIDVFRKRDPGPQFPWADVLAHSALTRLQAQTPP
ncbi:MAG: N-acetylmuramoyl-L-alanine amidase [Lysobacterales bacterium]